MGLTPTTQVPAAKAQSGNLRTYLLTGAAGVFGLRVAFGGLSFIATVVLARLLGTGGLGAFTYARAWILLLGIPAILGMDQLLVRNIAAYQAKAQWSSIRGLLEGANRAVLLASTGLALVAAAFPWAFSKHLSSEALITFWVALPLLPLITLSRVRQAALQGMHRVVRGAFPEQVVQPALFLALLGAAHLVFRGGLTAPWAMGLNVLAASAAFLLGAWMLRNALPPPANEAAPVFDGFDWRRSVLPLMFMAGAGVLYAQADSLLLGAIKGVEALGVYAVADKGAELIAALQVVVSAVLAPTAARLYAAGEIERLEQVFTKITWITLLASLPLAVGFIGFGRWFLLSFYGPKFTPAAAALAILSVGQLVGAAVGLVGILLIMTGHEADVALAIGGSAAANIVLNVVLIPKWGLKGAALANSSTTILWKVLMAVAVYRKLGIQITVLGKLVPGARKLPG